MAKCKDTLARKLFHGRCPYTEKPCETFDCLNCEVEEAEKHYMEEFDDSEGGLIEDD